MNPRQRRGVLLMVLSGLGAAVVFFSVVTYVASVSKEVGDLQGALRLRRDVAAFKPVSDDDLELVQVPKRWLPATAINDKHALQGKVAGTALKAGSFVQDGMLVEQPALQQGQREIAILIDAETGVAGKVRAGSVVDIYATYPGKDPQRPRSEIIVTNARVIEVGQLQTQNDAKNFDAKQKVPVTFALSIQESLSLTYAESFADHVRLALVGGGDRTALKPDERTFDGGLAGAQAPLSSAP